MSLSSRHRFALAGALASSAIALTDAVTHGLTGHGSPFSNDSETTWLEVGGTLVHGVTYLALALVVWHEAARFATTNRIARGARRVVLTSLVVLAVAFLTVVPVTTAYGVERGAFFDASGVVASVAFVGMILGALVLGLALLRSRALGIGARVLALMVPVFGLTLLLQWLAPPWAHPAYLETTLHLGLALLGVGVASAQPGAGDASAAPTAVTARD